MILQIPALLNNYRSSEEAGIKHGWRVTPPYYSVRKIRPRNFGVLLKLFCLRICRRRVRSTTETVGPLGQRRELLSPLRS